MLQPQYRLRDSVEIMKTLRHGARFRLSFCDIFISAPSSYAGVRIACIAGKRVDASAVRRHAAQRRLRSACARIIPFIGVPCNIVIVCTSSVVLDMDFNSLVQDLYYGILQGIA